MASRKIRLNQTVNGATLYHYTKSNGINGIINHNCFWATKSDFLNDPNEFFHIKGIIEKVVTEYIEDENLRDMFLKDVMKESGFIINPKQQDYFVLSFSSCRDSITMWSEFGNKTGYNIGLESEEITRRIKESNQIEFHGFVIYEEEQQKKIIAQVIEEYIPKQAGKDLNEILIKGAKNRENEEYVTACKKFVDITSVYAMFFKNEAFKEEQEYRFVFKKQKTTRVHFREKDGFMIPYIEIQLSDELLPVKEIMVAPQNHIDLAKNGMEYMMQTKGYDVDVHLSDIKLRY